LLDPVAALVVGLMVTRMGWKFSWDALHDLMDRAVDAQTVEAIRQAMAATPGVLGLHDLKTRKMGDFILADVHLEIDGAMTVEAGHDIALEARRRALEVRDVLNVMTHVDPVRVAPRRPVEPLRPGQA
jgi:cation diffusion facilitator family transporter